MAIYNDISITMTKIDTNDIGQLQDFNSIKTTLLNNISISSKEKFFDNDIDETIYDYLHSSMDFITENAVKNFIIRKALKDPRIISIDDIFIEEFPNSYKYEISIALTVDFNNPIETEIILEIIKEE